MTTATTSLDEEIEGIQFVDYIDESQLDHVMSLVGRDLSEPYSSELSAVCLIGRAARLEERIPLGN